MILILYKNEIKKGNTLIVLFEKSKTVSFAPPIMKNIAEPFYLSRFSVKLIYYIAFGSASGFCCLLKSIAVNL